MLKTIILLATISALTACYKPTPIEITSQEYKTYSVTKIYPPKHFYVDLKDLKSGRVHKKVYISKHCNEWRKLKIGSQWSLTEVDYKRGDFYGTKIEGASTICQNLKRL